MVTPGVRAGPRVFHAVVCAFVKAQDPEGGVQALHRGYMQGACSPRRELASASKTTHCELAFEYRENRMGKLQILQRSETPREGLLWTAWTTKPQEDGEVGLLADMHRAVETS